MKKLNGYIELFKSHLLTDRGMAFHSHWFTVSMMAFTLILLIGFLGGVVLFDSFVTAFALKLSMLLIPLAFIIDRLLISFVAPDDKTIITKHPDGLFFEVWIGRKLVNHLKIKSIEYWHSSPVGHTFNLNNHSVEIQADWAKNHNDSICCAVIEDKKGRKIQLFEALHRAHLSMLSGEATLKLEDAHATYPVKNLKALIARVEDELSVTTLSRLRLDRATELDVLELKAIESLKLKNLS